jgi:hypothetical protein
MKHPHRPLKTAGLMRNDKCEMAHLPAFFHFPFAICDLRFAIQDASERIRRRTIVVVSNIAGQPENPAGTMLGIVRSTEYARDETAPECRHSSERHGPLFDHLRA